MTELVVAPVKKPWFSKTLIVNFVMSALAVAGLTEKVGMSADQLVMALTGINIILRLVTKDKLGLDA